MTTQALQLPRLSIPAEIIGYAPTRQRERQMRHFESAAHVQRFASVHGVVQSLFRVGQHLWLRG